MLVSETQILSEPDGRFVMVLRVSSKCTWHIVDPLNLVGKGKYTAAMVPAGGLLLEPGVHVIGYSVERFNMPNDLFALVFGKSTYARHGLLVNATPIEPGWCGYLALGLCNVSNSPILVRPNQGIAQVVFFRVSEHLKYDGKHQGQQLPAVIPDQVEAETIYESLPHGPQV
jgi:deoxycytidine triphosphate deaminase